MTAVLTLPTVDVLLPHPVTRCACGCGQLFVPARSDQRYATSTCRSRASKARRDPRRLGQLLAELGVLNAERGA